MAAAVRVNDREVVRALRQLGRQGPQAVTRALNRTIRQVNTVAVREMAQDTGLPQREVRRATRIVRATFRQLRAFLEVTGRRIPLIHFRARGPEPSRGRGRGVTYRIGQQQRRLPHAFIATMRSGHRGVFARQTRKRLPIIELHGPSLPRVFVQQHIERALRSTVASRLPVNVKHEVEFLLRGGRGGMA